MKRDLSDMLATPGALEGLGPKLRMVASLTWPAIMAQLSNIIMEYIDASMVGSLGPDQAASVGLVATTTWLFWGLGYAACTGFAVQVAHLVGAGDDGRARQVLRQAVVAVLVLGVVLQAVGLGISGSLPEWLGGGDSIRGDARDYFAIFAAGLPFTYFTFLATTMLRSSGNMVVPGTVNVAMCVMDVIFNFFLIFPTRTVVLFGAEVAVPGAGMGVAGASLGTCTAYTVGGLYMWWFLIYRHQRLRHPYRGVGLRKALSTTRTVLTRERDISWPVALERVVMCGAQILITTIVAPLGNAAIAANAFAVTAESLCYAPGYGVGDAATTLVGQSLGAGRKGIAMSFARISAVSGMAVMAVLGMVMWVLAPEMMGLFSSDADILRLGTEALRIEAWAEPMFGAAIVIYGIFVGAGYTVVPACINFGSIWLVRISLSAILAPSYGLQGVWMAMCIELCVRGLLFIGVFLHKRWIRRFKPVAVGLSEASEQAGASGDDTPMVL